MTYQEFIHHILTGVRDALGSDYTVSVQDIVKNNDTHYDGLTILSSRHNLAPTIYLNHYYREYQNGSPLTDIICDILTVYRENRPSEKIDVSFFTDYDRVKSKIVCKLINFERNRSLLTDIPHYRFLDLAIVFSCLLEAGPSGSATILIRNQHLHLWSVTRDDLYAIALVNTPRLLRSEFRNMADILKELTVDTDCSGLQEDASCPMYILSNQYNRNGSVCILYQNLLKNFAEQLSCDLYILPSSIHEVLIIPAAPNTSCRELSEMVREINLSQLSKEEVLSDHVYYYSKDTARLTM